MMECDCCFGLEDPDEPDTELIPGDLISVDGVICLGWPTGSSAGDARRSTNDRLYDP